MGFISRLRKRSMERNNLPSLELSEAEPYTGISCMTVNNPANQTQIQPAGKLLGGLEQRKVAK